MEPEERDRLPLVMLPYVGDIQVRMDLPLYVDQDEGCTAHGEAIQGCTRFPAVVSRETFTVRRLESMRKEHRTPRCLAIG